MFAVILGKAGALLIAAAACAGFLAMPLSRPALGQIEEPIVWPMASAFSSELVQYGSLGKRVTEKIAQISDGSIQLVFHEPNSLMAPLAMFDGLREGRLHAAWAAPSHWVSQDEALALFSAVPFGPRAGEYAAWLYHGGGYALMDAIYAQYGIKSLVCGVAAPEAAGWFRREVSSVAELRGLRMRFFGLGSRVMERLGVETQLLGGGDIYLALEHGRIDATEFNMPAIDRALGFHKVAKHYYFPGWHQQASLLELMFNRNSWDRLSATQQAQIEVACGDNFRAGLAEGEAIQAAALAELEAQGVTLHRWPPEVLAALERTWIEVAEELSEQNPNFKRVWTSLSAFRAKNRIWRDLGFL